LTLTEALRWTISGRAIVNIVRKLLSGISPLWPHDPAVFLESEQDLEENCFAEILDPKPSLKSEKEADLGFV
jgi:hypothetical protein